MTTLELKKQLIKRISEIEDEAFLNSIKSFLESRTPSRTLTIPDDVRDEIETSREQIKKGLYVEQEELDEKVEEWLKGK